MEKFYQTHNELISKLKNPIGRDLINQVDWRHRLIGIKGTRGVGKTIFLLDYIKQSYGTDPSCLYVNLNNFYFSTHSLVDFAADFRKTGGKTLVLDQVFKYPNWSKAIRDIYHKFPDLNLIFTGSPVMRLQEDNPDLQDIVKAYHLRGLSFREYLNYKTNNSFDSYSLDDITKYHVEIAKNILLKVKPLAYFNDYLKEGFYPSFTEESNYNEHLIKIINLTLEIDIPFLQQMELKYLPKIKKLVAEISSDMPHTPNVSQLSASIETSRATVMNYLKYLKNARIITMLYNGEFTPSKKPNRLYLQNTNLLYALTQHTPSNQAVVETFFLSNIINGNKACTNGRSGEFNINNNYTFNLKSGKKARTDNRNYFTVADGDEVGAEQQIPLWLFGFLY